MEGAWRETREGAGLGRPHPHHQASSSRGLQAPQRRRGARLPHQPRAARAGGTLARYGGQREAGAWGCRGCRARPPRVRLLTLLHVDRTSTQSFISAASPAIALGTTPRVRALAQKSQARVRWLTFSGGACEKRRARLLKPAVCRGSLCCARERRSTGSLYSRASDALDRSFKTTSSFKSVLQNDSLAIAAPDTAPSLTPSWTRRRAIGQARWGQAGAPQWQGRLSELPLWAESGTGTPSAP